MSLQKQFTIFGQAYGTDVYGEQQYSCVEGDTTCQTTTEAAPNTGFFGTSDAALATTGGALLVAVALAGAIFVVVSRMKRNKNKEQ